MGKELRGFLSRFLGRMRGPEAAAVPESYSMLTCRETGMQKPLLRRHLREVLGMTPEEYRKKWRLPEDSPLVSQSYLDRREAARNMEWEG
ncbi:MucR family transcriptional regulator [Alloyangia pacifica]|uniref:ROS/MUCR transcriptional regulator protein n=1 Tax=Alloyangia pacifica TaxID=311180 RepID=A0A1I6T0M0_9RHOB|nr:MucR family transcriptional regulator [Alloyangia pacifica]SDG93481.1 ROS/MUCR transcriptional regulator protein [Alloyangia pacifica]SFS82794.1 ROS/MUCR transcriptional regulator protein [Alloyangia pacifica]